MIDIKGKALKFGDNINTDIISPPQYMEMGIEEASIHAMEAVDKDFAKRVKKGDIIAAGKNFGSGSSRETSPLALKYLGVSAVVSVFFARIFYRNCINVGLPVVECEEAEKIGEGDNIEIDIEEGTINNITKQETYKCSKLPPHIMKILESGGLRNMLMQEYKENNNE
ncbi:MAG: 3-isopropylmalate dehydratase [Eubacteriaceae bacterium]|jgi:3-isopropylmalate/(R)-2-methylmalate dehydratase small subunit|nr:3-isopropylmalate dehydratase [Eubacteriaceae bacterium]